MEPTMTFMLTDVASARNMINAPMNGSVKFISRLLVGTEDIAIVVTPGSIRLFVDDAEVRAGAQLSYVNEHASKILEQVDGKFAQGSVQVAIIGRWLKIAGLEGLEPYWSYRTTGLAHLLCQVTRSGSLNKTQT